MNRINCIMHHVIDPPSSSASLESNPSSSFGDQIVDKISSLTMGKMVETHNRHGGHLVARVLKEHGVKFVFTLVGGHISPILVAAKRANIRIIDVRHEVTSVFAADAVARLTGVAGVAAVTAGPGVTNTITAVKNAQMAQSPVVLLGGAAPSLTKGRGALQDIDQLSVIKPIVKFAASVTRVRDIVPTLRRAFQEAMSGVPGPVFVEFPLDVLYPMPTVRSEMDDSITMMRAKDIKPKDMKRLIIPDEAKGMTPAQYLESIPPTMSVFVKRDDVSSGGLLSHVMKFKLASLYGGAWQDTDFSPLPIQYPLPSASQVNRAADLVHNAKKPIFIIASQAMLHGQDGADRLRNAIERAGVPTFLGGMARGLLGRNSPYHIRQNRTAALKQADVVILAGVVADFRLSYGRSFSSRSKVVSINRSHEGATLNVPIFWDPTLTCIADPSDFMIQLSDAICAKTGSSQFDDWAKQLKQAEIKKEKKNFLKAKETAIGRGNFEGKELINPLDLFFQVENTMSDDSILVADGGDFVATGSYILRPRGPLRWLDPGAFGTLGVGGGFALGAKLVRPSAEVWLVWGDGSAGYSIAEFDTFKRHGVPIIALVGNDACWTQIEREQIPMFQDDVACPLDYCAYDKVASGYGGDGIVLTGSNKQDIIDGIKKAQQAAQNGMPFLLNVHIGKTDFREGSISV